MSTFRRATCCTNVTRSPLPSWMGSRSWSTEALAFGTMCMLPFAQFVVQPDRTIFLQQVRTSNLLTFTTNAPENTSRHEARRPIPITDPEAHVTFWLSMRTDATDQIRTIYELVKEVTGKEQ